MQIDDLLRLMVEKGASDLHVKVGMPPGYRISGRIVHFPEHEKLMPDVTLDLCRQVMSPEQFEEFQKHRDLDLSYSIPGLSRFRVNGMHQRGSAGMVIRQIPVKVPSIDELGLPDICKELSLRPRGLVLVTGPTGSGKSTTLAAMIDFINEHEEAHILTMEDPIEFIHHDKKSYISQREIGSDTATFSEALRRALRQDPDVILVGEMRDLETISMAVTAAETGHLVFGTLHTTSAIATVDRIIDVFPAEEQQQIRMQLSTTLQGVISQTLVPRIGGGRVAAHEIMIGTNAVRSQIREGKTAQLANALQTGAKEGMQTLEAALANLANQKLITVEDAMSKASTPGLVERMIKPGAISRKQVAGAPGASGVAGSAGVAGGAGGVAPQTAGAGTPQPALQRGQLDLGPKPKLGV